jgi:lysophospholipase L1-like esterase
VGLAYGTNDATFAVPIASFKATLQAMIDQIVASGRTPMLARTPYDLNGQLPNYVRAIDELTAANGLVPGPDLYTWFRDHRNEIGPDTVHPTVAGQASIQRLWGEAIARAYGAP